MRRGGLCAGGHGKPNGFPRDAIEKDSRGGRGEKGGNPIAEPRGESTCLKEVEDVVPTHRVEHLLDVKL